MKNELEMVSHKFGAVQVGYGFECIKRDGKAYAGDIVKVASYPRGTLVTIRFFENDDHFDDFSGRWVKVPNPVHKSVYLEECETWWVYVYNHEIVS